MAAMQVILEWKPEQVFWNTSVDDVVVLPVNPGSFYSCVFVSQAGPGLEQPVLIAFNAADDAKRTEKLSEQERVSPEFEPCGFLGLDRDRP